MIKRLILIPIAKLFGYRYLSNKDCFVRKIAYNDFIRSEKIKRNRLSAKKANKELRDILFIDEKW